MSRKKLTRKRVVDAIADIAFDDIGRYLGYETDEEGKVLLRVRDSAEVDTRNIQEVSVGRDGRLSFKLYSRERALYKLLDLVEPDRAPAKNGLLAALRQSMEADADSGEDELEFPLFQ